MPHALVCGHSMNIREPGIGELFNGVSIGFWTADVLEANRSFGDLLGLYNAWNSDALPPTSR